MKEEKNLIKRKEEQYVLEKRDRKRTTLCQQMQEWEDSIDMEIFLQIFEEAMIDGEYEETEWLKVLKKYLAGKALQVFTQVTTPGERTYSQVKEALLERLGTSTQQAYKRIWLEKKLK